MILVLVGDNGAGPHDLVRMMRDGRVYWSAPESQYYAEPKRLEAAGSSRPIKQPGRTHERTHYTLTDAGAKRSPAWLATPTRFPRIQNEPVVRLLGGGVRRTGGLARKPRRAATELDELDASLKAAQEREPGLPHRAKALRLNRRLAQRIVDAHRQWLDEVEAEL